MGNLTSTLKAKGLWEELVLFVTADNGAPTPSCGGAQGGQNHPLRETRHASPRLRAVVWLTENWIVISGGGKCSAWEGGLHGTAFVHSELIPQAARGKRLGALMHAVDVLPTLVAAA